MLSITSWHFLRSLLYQSPTRIMSNMTNRKPRAPVYIVAAAMMLFIFALWHHGRHQQFKRPLIFDLKPLDGVPFYTGPLRDLIRHDDCSKTASAGVDAFGGAIELSFYELALRHRSNKITTHSYYEIYQRYLPALRHRQIKMLQLGLDCELARGPGPAYRLWLDYFSRVELIFIDNNAACAREWSAQLSDATVVIGDASDSGFLERALNEHGAGGFDLIIDDGAKSMMEQTVALQTLWKGVKPGGIYFCENLQSSYMDSNGGEGAVAAVAVDKDAYSTTMRLVLMLIEDLMRGPRKVEFDDVEDMAHIDCSREICGFWRRGLVEISVNGST